MARRPRLHVPGGFYHVTLRGNHRQPVFFADSDRLLLNSIVAEATAALDSRVHAFCWMTNHIHLLVQVSDRPLGRFVHRIASRYARAVQARLTTTGHLFERRYHGALVDTDNYLFAVLRYIHLNPVEAGIVDDPARYEWSSHRAYLRLSICNWLTTAFVMKALADDHAAALRRYRSLIRSVEAEDALFAEKVECADRTGLLGDTDFASKVGALNWNPAPRLNLDELVAACCHRFGVTDELLASPRKCRRLSAARAWLAHKVAAGHVCSISAVARRLARSESSLRELMARNPIAGLGD